MIIKVKHFIKGGELREDIYYNVASVTFNDTKTYIAVFSSVMSYKSYKTFDVVSITDATGRVIYPNKELHV